MSNRTGFLILILLILNIAITFLFDWHFHKAPFKEDIFISKGYEKSYQIYIPMYQTYDVYINFAKNKADQVFGPMTSTNVKDFSIKMYWEITQGSKIVESQTVVSNEICSWSDNSVSKCFGSFNLPEGNYNFKLQILDKSKYFPTSIELSELEKYSIESSEFVETTLTASHNLKGENTWQTGYIFLSMLFNLFIAPIIAGIILIIFSVRFYRSYTRSTSS